MPRPTFFNLPEEKRNALVAAAIDEFAENDFQSASISRLVANLGIAKGSFYQYFDDKRDLYFYLIDHVMKERMDFIRRETSDEKKADYLLYLQDLLETGIRYDAAYPRHGQLIFRAMNSNGPRQRESMEQFKSALLDYQREIITLGIAMGKIDPEIDPEFLAQFLNVVMVDFGRSLMASMNVDPERVKQGDFSQFDTNLMHEKSRQVIDLIFNGIAKK